MALGMTHQIGSLAGTPIPVETGTTNSSETTATLSAASMWKSPANSLRCRVQKPEIVDALSPPVSPCRSPVLGSTRADLSVACRAFATETEVETARSPAPVREYREEGAQVKGQGEKGVPVYVMMPLDSVTMNNTVNRKKAMNASLQALKSAGVEGIMMDVWWGLVERDAPGAYNWGGYAELLEMAKKHGLKVQAVMSFHKCGGNVGDSVTCVPFLTLSCYLFVLGAWSTRSHPPVPTQYLKSCWVFMLFSFFLFTVFLCLNGLEKRLRKIRTLHTLINGERGIMNIYRLALIPFQFLRDAHLCSVILTSCVPSETTLRTYLVTPLW